jgi:hypothetical protein
MEALRDPEFVDDGTEVLELDIDDVWAWLTESVTLREAVRLSVVDIEDDAAVEILGDIVLAILSDALTEPDEEGILLGDVDGDTDWATDDVGVPDAGSVATSNPIELGGTHSHNGAVGSLHGSAYTPN